MTTLTSLEIRYQLLFLPQNYSSVDDWVKAYMDFDGEMHKTLRMTKPFQNRWLFTVRPEWPVEIGRGAKEAVVQAETVKDFPSPLWACLRLFHWIPRDYHGCVRSLLRDLRHYPRDLLDKNKSGMVAMQLVHTIPRILPDISTAEPEIPQVWKHACTCKFCSSCASPFTLATAYSKHGDRFVAHKELTGTTHDALLLLYLPTKRCTNKSSLVKLRNFINAECRTNSAFRKAIERYIAVRRWTLTKGEKRNFLGMITRGSNQWEELFSALHGVQPGWVQVRLLNALFKIDEHSKNVNVLSPLVDLLLRGNEKADEFVSHLIPGMNAYELNREEAGRRWTVFLAAFVFANEKTLESLLKRADDVDFTNIPHNLMLPVLLKPISPPLLDRVAKMVTHQRTAFPPIISGIAFPLLQSKMPIELVRLCMLYGNWPFAKDNEKEEKEKQEQEQEQEQEEEKEKLGHEDDDDDDDDFVLEEKRNQHTRKGKRKHRNNNNNNKTKQGQGQGSPTKKTRRSRL